jgi:hypothetical protein
VLFVLGIVFRRADNGLQRGVVQHRTDAAQDVGKHHVAERRDHDADEVHAVGGQRARDLVGHVAERPGGGEHPFARLFGDVAALAQDAADGHFGHARGLGHVAKRHLGLAVERVASAQIGVPEQEARLT